VFLAADKTRLQDLNEAVRRYLAWKSIVTEKDLLNLDPHQLKQAESQCKAAESTVTARIPETYQWLLIPTQATPQSPVEWQASRLTGQEALAERASKKIRGDQLYTSYAATLLRMELDGVPLWRGEHVEIKQLVEDFARYLYLPRLRDPKILLAAIRDGVTLLTWEQDSFAFADSYDEKSERYRGLRCCHGITLADADSPGLLVRPSRAKVQLEAEAATTEATSGAGPRPTGTANDGDGTATTSSDGSNGPGAGGSSQPKRFHGSIALDSTRVGRDASRVADEVIAHLSGLVGAKVHVTLEIQAEIPDGAPENVVRAVTENSRTLRFSSHGFEAD
jgi:hypothetical protein